MKMEAKFNHLCRNCGHGGKILRTSDGILAGLRGIINELLHAALPSRPLPEGGRSPKQSAAQHPSFGLFLL
jgi:hypothetical protein